MKNEIHEGWTIQHKPHNPLRWEFWHEEYEASYEGEQWVSNGLCGCGTSKEDCINQIQEIEMDPEYCHIFNISPCCGAEIYEDTDICSQCKEHC